MNVSVRSLAVAMALVLASAARAEDGVLKVVAEARMGVLPDRAEMGFTIKRLGGSVAEAVSACAAAYDSVSAALKKAGLGAEAITTGRFSAGPHLDRSSRDGATAQVGYEASQYVRARLKDPTKAARAVSAVAGVDGINMGGLSWSTSLVSELADQALAAAVRRAREKADIMAKAAGVRLGSIVELTTTDRGDLAVQEVSSSLATLTISPDSVFVRSGVAVTWKLVEPANEH